MLALAVVQAPALFVPLVVGRGARAAVLAAEQRGEAGLVQRAADGVLDLLAHQVAVHCHCDSAAIGGGLGLLRAGALAGGRCCGLTGVAFLAGGSRRRRQLQTAADKRASRRGAIGGVRREQAHIYPSTCETKALAALPAAVRISRQGPLMNETVILSSFDVEEKWS
jgi:hypothetical protein